MGCIPSKAEAVTRSLSFQEELNRGFQRTSKDIPMWEELLTSNNASEQFLAFLYSAQTANELTNRDPSIAVVTAEIAKGKEDGESSLQPRDVVGTKDFGRLSRSKSCQIIPDKEFPIQDPQIEGLRENKLDWRDKNTRGSRSFHTVEEYDSLLKRAYISSTSGRESFRENESSLNENVQISKPMDEYCDDGNIHGNAEDFPKNKFDSIEGPSEHKSSSSNSTEKSDKNYVQEGAVCETGWKRKAVGQGLKSLHMSPVEFPAIARLGQWLHVEGQVYSPGTYVTPKFGCYNKVNPVRREEDGNRSVFSPEVVAAFEECLQQLEAEEESILSYFNGYLHANKEMENHIQEDCNTEF
ncbi:Hypothetical predicted protein [Olea europaea subsp. europaea]|uniref:Uncharacterized protein n=1 Tax=Olea europaea subsp. europaea TaxID=158383 RepID=A0A8S0UV13_OLEEU|nr:Hypothetical predicted protein [Olea europaea subsp. europaea]